MQRTLFAIDLGLDYVSASKWRYPHLGTPPLPHQTQLVAMRWVSTESDHPLPRRLAAIEKWGRELVGPCTGAWAAAVERPLRRTDRD